MPHSCGWMLVIHMYSYDKSLTLSLTSHSRPDFLWPYAYWQHHPKRPNGTHPQKRFHYQYLFS